MNNKKTYTFVVIILITLSLGLGSFDPKMHAANPTEPILESLVAEGLEDFQGINFPNLTLITVEYSVDRFIGISGIVIVGSGSNLSLTPETSLALNYSSSLVERSYYKGTFSLTGLTS